MTRSTAARALATTALLLLSLAGAPPAPAQLPAPVQGLDWCPGAKNCLVWTEVDGATAYHLYRGHAGGLPGLVDETVDSCAFGSFVAATTGGLLGDPAAGGLDWYLVTAANLFGEGSPSDGSFGPRVLDSAGPCGAAPGLVINEVDYDQPGTDSAEFVEIFNAGTSDRDLSGLLLILVNGLSSSEYARVELDEAGPTLPAGGYLVVGAPGVVAALPFGTPSVTFPSSTNNLQNGAPDGMAIFDPGAVALLDALSYEGAITAAQFDGVTGSWNLVEGNEATAQDSNSLSGSLVRFPDGADTDQADADWHFVEATSPGEANPEP